MANRWWSFVALAMLMMGCASQRTALREPANRWELASLPKSPAPMDLHATPIPGFNETIAALWVTPITAVVFVTAAEPRAHRQPRLRLAKAGQIRLVEARALDLYCPQPLWIPADGLSATGKKMRRLVTAEALIFR